MEGLSIGSILAGIIASLVVGGGVAYKVIITNSSKKGINQNKGTNQIALQKSKGNTINIGKDINNEKKED